MKYFLLLGSLLLVGCGLSLPREAMASAPAKNPIKHLSLMWEYPLKAPVVATPVVSGNQLLVAAENGNLYSLELSTRKLSWLYRTEAGIASTPAVADGLVYFLSRDGFFYALEQHTGKRVWRVATGGEGRFAMPGAYGLPASAGAVADPWDFHLSSPVIAGGIVYFGSTDKHLYALNALTGERVWVFRADEAIHSSPVIAKGKLFFGTWGTRLYALDLKTGKEIWNYTGGVDPTYFVMQGITAAPAVDEEFVYIGARDGFIYSLRQTDGALRWKYDASSSWILTKAALDEDNLYVGTSDTGLLLALDKRTGVEKFRANTRLWTYASPLLVGRYVFVGTMAGELYAFDKTSGSPVWYYQTPAGRADANDIVDNKTGKLRNEKLFSPSMQLQASVEWVKALGAFVAAPIWVNEQIIAVTATGEILVFGARKPRN